MADKKHHSSLSIFIFTGLCLFLINFFFPAQKSYDESFALSTELIDCTLEKILDGDTLTANCAERYLSIRLSGIDAPELEQDFWGEQAYQALKGLMTPHFMLLPQGQDIYERQLGIIFVQGKEINLAMIEQGYAVVYQSKEMPAEYLLAEKIARQQKIGIWSKIGTQQNPSRWRREHQE